MGSKTTSQVTNTPNPTATAAYDNVLGQASNVASTPYQPYGGELVAGLNGGQTQAIGQLEGVYGTAHPFFQGGADQLANASGGLGAVQGYLQAGSAADAGVGQFQGQAAGQYGTAADYVNQSGTALAGVQPYLNAAGSSYGQAAGYGGQAAASYGAMGGMIGSADTALGQAGQSYAQAGAGLGQVGQYLGAANGYFGQAASLAAPQDFASNVGTYENPYTSDVINTTMAQAEQADQVQASSLAGNAIGSGAYGGDRNGIAQAALAGQQDLANNSTIAGLNQANFSQATNEFNAVQGQRQQGASILSGLGQGELQAGGTQLQDALGYAQVGAGQNANAAGYASLGSLDAQQGQGYAGLGSLANATGAGYAGLAGVQGQTAQQLGNLGSISSGIGSGYDATGQLGLGAASEYGSLGQLQGTTGQAYGTLGGLYGNIGTQAQAAATSGASAGLQGATLEQQTQQAQDTAAYQQFQNQIQYPFNTTGFLSNIVQGIGSASGGTQTTQGSGLSQIAGAATSGLGILGATGAFGANGYLNGGISAVGNSITGLGGAFTASDERMKENIEPVGETYDGQTIHRYNYKGDPRTQVGLIAQEVEGAKPDAVSTPPGLGGLKAVDYARATDDAADRGRFSRGGGLGDIGRMLGAPNAIRLPTSGGLGGVRHHFDAGGSIGTVDGSLQSDDFASDLAHNPLLASRAVSAGGQSSMPGGNLSRMPGGFSGMPSGGGSSPQGGGLGALTAAPSAGGLSNVGSTPSPPSSGFSSGAASGADGAGSDTFGPGDKNLWLSLIAGGAGAMSGGSASGLSNIGKGISDGLGTYMGLHQQDITNARAALELARQQQQLRIDQQRADQSGQQISDEAAFRKGSLANSAAETAIRQQSADSENAARNQTTAINRYPQVVIPGVGTFYRDATDPTSGWRPVGSGTPASSVPAPSAVPSPAPPASPVLAASTASSPQPVSGMTPPAARPQPPTASAAPATFAGQGTAISPNNPQAGSSLVPSAVSPSWRPVTTVPAGFVPTNSASIALGGDGGKAQAEIGQKQVEGLQTNAAKAATAQQQLYQMNAAIDGLPKSGLLAPGAFGDQRAAAANAVNAIAATVGAQPPFNPNQAADAQELAKGAFRLGTSMIADTNGGREAGFILANSVKNVPSINNSYLGFKRVASGIDQANQYAMDKSNFISDYYAKFHHTDGAEAEFNNLNPWQNYAQRAIDNSTMPSAPPQGVPAGSAYSMSRQQWRGPDGSLYSANGQRMQ